MVNGERCSTNSGPLHSLSFRDALYWLREAQSLLIVAFMAKAMAIVAKTSGTRDAKSRINTAMMCLWFLGRRSGSVGRMTNAYFSVHFSWSLLLRCAFRTISWRVSSAGELSPWLAVDCRTTECKLGRSQARLCDSIEVLQGVMSPRVLQPAPERHKLEVRDRCDFSNLFVITLVVYH